MHDTTIAEQSLLSWAFSALGPMYAILLPLSALAGFVFTLMLVWRGKGPWTAASILLFVHLPLMIGLYAAFSGSINSFQVIAMGGATPKPADIAVGVSMSLFAPLVAMLLMALSYLVAAIGTFARAMTATNS